ncbi:hypothetical protein [Pseudorhodoferax soli]|uniref:Virulence factor lipase-like protein n=1 Tax=Pseudorhodoferax soli TaxID=545864 RepID=A0A368XHE4_9BURK|nr:hypothetical protein [Pseudorhodoferax soli]RCW67373.1 hypothetical protein DES41_10996 [Pseudorhodoferax soli]
MKKTTPPTLLRLSVLALVAAVGTACGGSSDDTSDVAVAFSSSKPDAAPFPSDRYTVADTRQLSQLRVALPKPDCAVRVSDCYDIDELNTLDGFSLVPRFTVPFTGDIDPATVTSDSVYLLELASGRKIGINQTAWDAPARLLSFKSDELLREQQRYLMVVTDRVRDTAGKRLGGGEWLDASSGLAIGRASESGGYREALRQALAQAPANAGKPVAATLFTTQNATATLAAMAAAAKARTATGIDFMVATQGGTPARALFGIDQIASGVVHRQSGTAPQFADTALRLSALQVVPGSVAQVGFGRFASPTFLDAKVRIAPTGTAALPQLLGETQVAVQVFVPAGTKPAGGWPVVLFGHGLGNNMHDSPWAIASVLASYGLATASIHVVGHGGGAQSTLELALSGGGQASVAVPGRGIDQNGDGQITPFEGATAPAPYGVIGSRDALRQTVTDLVELARRFQAGVDIDGDGQSDFDGRRVTYSGQSFGGVYGTMLLAVDKDLVAGVPNVGGGSLIEATRLGGLRSLRVASLAGRTPSLINLPPTATGAAQFDENLPFRGQPVLSKHVDGAQAIAKLFDHSEWAQQSGEATAYAPLIRLRPLAGHAPKPIVYQLAKGDTVMTNTSSGMVVRGGALGDRVSWFRHDLAFNNNNAVARNPHGYMLDITNPAALPYALQAQRQIGAFLASGGTDFSDADGTGPYYENVVDPAVLDALNFLP